MCIRDRFILLLRDALDADDVELLAELLDTLLLVDETLALDVDIALAVSGKLIPMTVNNANININTFVISLFLFIY